MQYKDTQQIFTQLQNIVKQRKLLILLCTFGILAPIIIYNETAPEIYQASVSIIFEDISNPLTQDNYNPLRTFQRETFILNRIQEIKTLALAEEIAAAVPSDLVNRFNFPEEPSVNFNKKKFLTNQIRKSISTEAIRRTDVIRIKVLTHDPFLSMSLANVAAEVLRERNLKFKKNEVSGLREFIEEQLRIFQEKLNNSEQKLMEFKEENRITSLEQESREILRRITEAEVKYNQAKTQRRSTEERLAVLQNKLTSNREKLVPTVTDVISPSLTLLKEKLVELQVQYTSLQVQDYSVDHPKLLQLQSEIDLTKKTLTEEALKLVQGGIVVDPLSQIQTYLTETVTFEIELESLKAQEKALKQIVTEYENTLKTLPEKERELASFIRAKDVNEKLYVMLMEKREQAKISEAEKNGNLRIIDKAQLPGRPISPNKKKNLAIGVMMGLLVGFGLAFFLESMNTTLKTSEDIEKLTSWQVLAVIPNIELPKNGKVDFSNASHDNMPDEPNVRRALLSNFDSTAMAAEAFRVLRTNIQFLHHKINFKTILMTSISPGDGKSTISTNFGIALTKLGLKVLIIDADLRRSTIHKLFEIEKEPGLCDVLLHHHIMMNDFVVADQEKSFNDTAGDSPIWTSIQNLKNHDKNVNLLEDNFKEFTQNNNNKHNETIQPKTQYRNLLKTSLIESVQATRINNLKVLSSGKSVPNPSEILSTVSMKWLLDEVSSKYDLIIIDSPPLLLVPDSMIISSIVDGVLVVIESNKIEQNMILNAKKFLKKTNTPVLGLVLNKVDPKMIFKDKDYYYYG